MALPFTREKTVQPGGIVEHTLISAIQDAIVTVASRTMIRTFVVPINGNVRVVSGTASWIGSVLVSTADADAYRVGINGLWVDPTANMVQVRVRLNQIGADALQATLWEVDDTQAATAIATATTDATTGLKWLTLSGFTRPILSGFEWTVRLDHVGGSPTNINISLIEVSVTATP